MIADKPAEAQVIIIPGAPSAVDVNQTSTGHTIISNPPESVPVVTAAEPKKSVAKFAGELTERLLAFAPELDADVVKKKVNEWAVMYVGQAGEEQAMAQFETYCNGLRDAKEIQEAIDAQLASRPQAAQEKGLRGLADKAAGLSIGGLAAAHGVASLPFINGLPGVSALRNAAKTIIDLEGHFMPFTGKSGGIIVPVIAEQLGKALDTLATQADKAGIDVSLDGVKQTATEFINSERMQGLRETTTNIFGDLRDRLNDLKDRLPDGVKTRVDDAVKLAHGLVRNDGAAGSPGSARPGIGPMEK